MIGKFTQVGFVFLVGLLLLTGGMWSYVKTAGRQVVEAVKSEVPVEFEIDRARQLVDDLVPEIRKNIELVARESVEIEELEGRTADAASELKKGKQDVLQLRDDLKEGKEKYQYGGNEYTRAQVVADLAEKFERHKRAEAAHASLQQMKKARQASLSAAQAKLDNMVDQKRQLAVKVEELASHLRMQQVSSAANGMNLDKSKLTRAKQAITDIVTRLKVADRVLTAQTAYAGQIDVNAPASRDIVTEVTEYFSDVGR